jgi:hypothetical protein
MMRLHWLLIFAFACHDSHADPTKDKTAMTPVTLDFTTRVDSGKLHLDYTLTNHSKDAFWVNDVMLAPTDGKLSETPDAIIVTRGSSPAEVRFVRGNVAPYSKVNVHYPTAALRSLAAGGTLTGSAIIGLPIKAWHPYGLMQDLDGPPKQATLDVDVFPASVAVTTAKLGDGTSLSIAAPTASPPVVVHAGPKQLP